MLITTAKILFRSSNYLILRHSNKKITLQHCRLSWLIKTEAKVISTCSINHWIVSTTSVAFWASSDAKALEELPLGLPWKGAPNTDGFRKMCDFRPVGLGLSRYISKTVGLQDRNIESQLRNRMWSIKRYRVKWPWVTLNTEPIQDPASTGPLSISGPDPRHVPTVPIYVSPPLAPVDRFWRYIRHDVFPRQGSAFGGSLIRVNRHFLAKLAKSKNAYYH